MPRDASGDEASDYAVRMEWKHEFEASIFVVEATILRGWLASEAPQIHTWKARPHQMSIDLAGLDVRMGAQTYALLGMFTE